MKFSFSSERSFRRCQRQYYFRDSAAWHNAKDPVRREAFVLKQLKTIELWRGHVVHRGIEKFVIPALESNSAVDWNSAADQTVEMARRQLVFSAARKYREKGLSKTAAADDYCALAVHVSIEDFAYANSPGTCALCPFRPMCLGQGVQNAELLTQLV